MSETCEIETHFDLIYDVGMHSGGDTAFYLKKGFRVIGFEANPDLVEECRRRFADEIKHGKLIVVEGAIVEPTFENGERKTIQFYKNKDLALWGTVCTEWDARNRRWGTSSETIEVPIVDFAQCLKEYGMPHYLKIDIEGMDLVCLKALTHFKQKPDYVSMESDISSLEKLQEELDLFTQLGYTEFQCIQQSRTGRQREPNPPREGRYSAHRLDGCSGLFGADLPYKWKDYKQMYKQYKFITLVCDYFADNGKLSKSFLGKCFKKAVRILLFRQIPGWYDTHAKHSSVHP
jgi:FkbM family methyltransferase